MCGVDTTVCIFFFILDDVQGSLNCTFDGTTCGYTIRHGNQFFTWHEARVTNVLSAWNSSTASGYFELSHFYHFNTRIYLCSFPTNGDVEGTSDLI